MPVFLSHKREDTVLTLSVARYLQSKQVKCYVDAFDLSLQTTDDITKHLMSRVRACSHLMAVVSSYTMSSWWVPFEIGVATELDRRITTYKLSAVNLPDFLSKWPVLSSQADLDKFIAMYQNDSTIEVYESRSIKASIKSASVFHAALKSTLGQ